MLLICDYSSAAAPPSGAEGAGDIPARAPLSAGTRQGPTTEIVGKRQMGSALMGSLQILSFLTEGLFAEVHERRQRGDHPQRQGPRGVLFK